MLRVGAVAWCGLRGAVWCALRCVGVVSVVSVHGCE